MALSRMPCRCRVRCTYVDSASPGRQDACRQDACARSTAQHSTARVWTCVDTAENYVHMRKELSMADTGDRSKQTRTSRSRMRWRARRRPRSKSKRRSMCPRSRRAPLVPARSCACTPPSYSLCACVHLERLCSHVSLARSLLTGASMLVYQSVVCICIHVHTCRYRNVNALHTCKETCERADDSNLHYVGCG